MADQRFSKGKSVHGLGIRSALCVPIKARKLGGKDPEEIVGVIYIDSSVHNYTYSPDQLRLLTAIGSAGGHGHPQRQALSQPALQAERLAAIGETTAAPVPFHQEYPPGPARRGRRRRDGPARQQPHRRPAKAGASSSATWTKSTT